MTDRVDQLVFAFTDRSGISIVSSSLRNGDVDAWDGWDNKLRQHSRLLSSAEGTPPPSTSFSHLAFPDGTAAVLRRFARPGDSGRNVAHALVGDRAALAEAAPRLTYWDGWLDDAPITTRMDALSLALLVPDVEPYELNDPLLVPILAAVLARPHDAFSIIGVPEELRLPALWRVRTLARHAGGGSEWTFSTYEETDRHKFNLPRFIFLAERPQDVIPQPGRVRIDVDDEVSYTDFHVRQALAMLEGRQAAPIRATPEEPATTVLEVVRPPIPQPVPEQAIAMPPPEPVVREPVRWPAFAADPVVHRILRGEEPLGVRLLQFADRLESLNGDVWHEPLAEWVEHADVPDPFVAVLIDHLRAKGCGGFEQALAGRFLARQGVGREVEQPKAGSPAPRKPADHEVARLVWGKQLAWSAEAGRHKTKAVRLRWFVLATLVGGAAGAVVVPQVSDLLMSWAVSTIAALIALGVFTGTWVRTTQEPEARRRWTHARSVSEKLKAEACRYLAGAAPYRDAGAALLLRDRVKQIEGTDQLNVAGAHTPPIRDVESYVELRARDQLRHHAKAAAGYERRLKIARVAEFVLGALAAVLAAVGVKLGGDVAVWAGVLTGTAGAITAHIAQTGYEHLVGRYKRTVKELKQLLEARPEAADQAARDAFVADCELVLAQQNADWLAQLMPAAKAR